ncbi:MAG: spore germination protein [Tissierellaceae bacterium]
MNAKLSKDIEENIRTIEGLFMNCYDIVIRRLEIGGGYKVKIAVLYIDGLIDKNHVSEYTIGFLNSEASGSFSAMGHGNDILDTISKEVLANAEIEEESNMENIVDAILSGDAVLMADKADKAIVIGSRGWVFRSIEEPQTEAVIRGPREGFTEVLKFNVTMIRRRIKDTNLKIVVKPIGRRSKTAVAILYMEDIVDKTFLQELNRRLQAVDIDSISDSSSLEYLIEDNYMSAFPQIENTERPDSVAASLYEGRVALIVDNSPFALILPATIGTILQSSEDYYSRWSDSTFVRFIRIIAVGLTVLSPSLYIAITAYHPGLLPAKLTYFLAASRIDVPFPAVVEATLMELTLELLRESGTRVAGPIGSTVGIVGGLIIGQAAVDAGIVSPLMIIIVAVTTIASFVIPSHEFASGLRVWRFILMGFSAVLGLYGIMLAVILLISHLIKMDSFGIPYTSPYSGLGIATGDLKDTLIKAPIQHLRERPNFTRPQNKVRMGGYWKNGRK